jgi:hypothetical protein
VPSELILTRRKLIGAGAGAAAATVLGTRAPRAPGATAAGASTDAFVGPAVLPSARIGLQLFSIRDQVSSLGFAEVFETLAAIGYKAIEFAGYTQGSVGPITLAQIKQLMDANGLVGVGSHVSISDANIQQVLDAAVILGLPYVGLASASSQTNTVAGWQQTAANFNRWGAAASARGIKFYWHNHQTEFGFTMDQPTTRIYDILLEETDPALVFMEMDIYWAYEPGALPPLPRQGGEEEPGFAERLRHGGRRPGAHRLRELLLHARREGQSLVPLGA